MKYLIFLLALPTLAQFSSLATTPDGSKLYFVSSLRQRNTNQPLHGKVFSLDDREMKPALILNEIKLDDQWSNFYNITAPYLDSNGNLIGYSALRKCYISFFQACKAFEGSSWSSLQFQGTLTFSPNRRFALNAVWGGLSDYGFTLRNLETSQRLATATAVNGAHAVTDEGVVWRVASNGLERLAAGATSFETFIPNEQAPFLSGVAHIPGTSKIMTWQLKNLTWQLIEIDTSTKQLTPISRPLSYTCDKIAAATGSIRVALCHNGKTTELLRLDSPTSDWRPIARSINTFTIAANGNILWYAGGGNSIHKVNLLEETDQTRLPPMRLPAVTQPFASPGSLYFIEGSGIGNSLVRLVSPNSPSRPLTPLLRQPDRLVYLIPTDLPPPIADYRLEMENPAPSLFDYSAILGAFVLPTAPLFFEAEPELGVLRPVSVTASPLAIQRDFSSTVTRERPARPGSIVHLYAVNLSPSGTPDLRCIGSYSENSPLLLYAGPAPGIMGIYQISVQLPLAPPDPANGGPMYQLSCNYSNGPTTTALIPAAP
ncbi:MAG: hypothetical protein FJW36_17115 [Acidobacteria bacterium]|nr:hypothetical protein [Acidobacteriota bacterium]